MGHGFCHNVTQISYFYVIYSKQPCVKYYSVLKLGSAQQVTHNLDPACDVLLVSFHFP